MRVLDVDLAGVLSEGETKSWLANSRAPNEKPSQSPPLEDHGCGDHDVLSPSASPDPQGPALYFSRPHKVIEDRLWEIVP